MKEPTNILGAGIAIGVTFGVAIGNVGLGIALGLAIGAAMSTSQKKNNKAAEKIDGAKMLFISTPPKASVFRRIYSLGNCVSTPISWRRSLSGRLAIAWPSAKRLLIYGW